MFCLMATAPQLRSKPSRFSLALKAVSIMHVHVYLFISFVFPLYLSSGLTLKTDIVLVIKD